MSTEGLLSGGDVARLLSISRQRLGQLRDNGNFPPPISKMGATYVWRMADVQEWLDTRRGDRPEVHPDLERRARQLERLGYTVSVTKDEGETTVMAPGGDFAPAGSHLWGAWISMRGNMSVGSEHEHEDPSAALYDALMHFDKVAGRRFTDRDVQARIQELIFGHGWREGEDGVSLDTAGNWWTYRLDPPDNSEPIKRKGDTPLEARLQVLEAAEARQAEIDGEGR